jgi:hypothetical protein
MLDSQEEVAAVLDFVSSNTSKLLQVCCTRFSQSFQRFQKAGVPIPSPTCIFSVCGKGGGHEPLTPARQR